MKIIEVNLLPPEYMPESPYSLRNVIALVLSLMIVGFLVMIAFQMLAIKETYMRENSRLMIAISAFRKEKEKLEAFLKRKSELERRYKMVGEVLEERRTWSDKLSELCNAIPDGMWIQDIFLQKSVIEITGQASGLEPIEKLIRNLEKLSSLENPSFASIDRRSLAEHELYQFKLSVKIKNKRGGGER